MPVVPATHHRCSDILKAGKRYVAVCIAIADGQRLPRSLNAVLRSSPIGELATGCSAAERIWPALRYCMRWLLGAPLCWLSTGVCLWVSTHGSVTVIVSEPLPLPACSEVSGNANLIAVRILEKLPREDGCVHMQLPGTVPDPHPEGPFFVMHPTRKPATMALCAHGVTSFKQQLLCRFLLIRAQPLSTAPT